MTEANQVVEDEQPLVDLELLAHYEAQDSEREVREDDLAEYADRIQRISSGEEEACDEDADFVLLDRLFPHRRAG